MEDSQRIWQISGGPSKWPYGEVFLKHGVALVGPGDAGPWRRDDPQPGLWPDAVWRFATEVRSGDIMLLRVGTATITAIGLVAGDYVYLPQFDDVNGWALPHARRVRWFGLPAPYTFEERVFGAYTAALGRVNAPALVDYAARFLQSPPTAWQNAPLPPLPPEEPALEIEAVPASLQALTAQVQDLGALYGNPTAFGEPPSESELVTHYVVPFLCALGWPPELIALQWRDTDVCLFRRLPRAPENCFLVVEAKRPGVGAESALEQALEYLVDLGIRCDVLVTDGFRYRLYGAERKFTPVAYANLARLKQPALDLFARLKRT